MWSTEKHKRVDPDGMQTLTTSGTAAQSAAINAAHVADPYIRIAASADAYILIGVNPTVTASNGFLMPAGTIDYFRISPGDKVSALQVTAAGKVTVSLMEP